MTSACVVVPFRSFEGGKSRLGDVLPPPARRQLCEAMLARTLEIAAGFPEVVVVSDDAAVEAFIRERGHRAAFLLAPERGNLNAALAHASRLIADRAPMIVLPTDLVCLDARTLHGVAADPARLTIAPDRSEDGTNLLAIPARAVRSFRFEFGPGSFARHVAGAIAIDEPPQILRSPRIAFDLDGPVDLRLAAEAQCPVVTTLGGVSA